MCFNIKARNSVDTWAYLHLPVVLVRDWEQINAADATSKVELLLIKLVSAIIALYWISISIKQL